MENKKSELMLTWRATTTASV